MTKHCHNCATTKPIEAFSRNRRKPDGRQTQCKVCMYVRVRDWAKGNPERIKQHQKRWIAKPDSLELIRLKSARKLAKRFGTVNTLTIDEWLEVLDEYGRQCVYCHGPFEEMDHRIPTSKGGPNSKGNVFPCCKPCNSSKKQETWELGCRVPISNAVAQ